MTTHALTPDDTDHATLDLLTSRELLALQLHARGYSERQIASLTGCPPDEVRTLLSDAAAALGTADANGAIAEATRRGLIV